MPNAEFVPFDEDNVTYEVTDAPKTHADLAIDGLVSALNDTSDSAIVSLYRQSGSGKESQTFLESMAPDKFTPDDLLMYIRNSYGGGDYRIHVRENGKLRANKHVSIETPKQVPRETHGNESPALLQAIASMNEQIQRQNQMLQHSMSINKPQDEQDFLNKMVVYKQLFDNGGSSKPQGIQEILSTVKSLKELGINVGGINTGDDDKEEGFGGMLEKATPILTALLNNQNNAPQQPHPNYKPNPQPRPNPQQSQNNMMTLKLKMGVATLVKAAAKKSPSEFYADFVADNVDDKTIKEFITHPDALEKLVKIDKRVAEHKEWFKDVGEHLKAMTGDKSSKYFNDYNDLSNDDESVINGEIDTESLPDDDNLQPTSDK